MITFDKLKVVSDIANIEIIDEGQFEKVIKDGVVTMMKYHMDKAFQLDIKIDYIKRELVIEFTGRILGKDYTKLISINTINQCFGAINSLGFCHIDVEAMMDADVVKCDITKDIEVDDIPQLITYVRNHNKNYQKKVCRKMNASNLSIEKNVTSKRLKKRMIIYDKGKEMNNVTNKQFADDYGLDGVFNGKCRFELNLNSKQQIRSSLNISNTKLKSVLMADVNPIVDFLDEVIEPSPESITLTDKKTFFTKLVLEKYDYDLEKIEAIMRNLYPSRGTNIKKIMEPYRLLVEQKEITDGANDYWSNIRKQLL